MFKIAALLFVIIAPTLMGTLVTVVLVTPALYNGVGISVAALAGAVIAAPDGAGHEPRDRGGRAA